MGKERTEKEERKESRCRVKMIGRKEKNVK